jgi:hypothetical protein
MLVEIQPEIKIVYVYDAPLSNLQLFEIKIFIKQQIAFNTFFTTRQDFWTPFCLILEMENKSVIFFRVCFVQEENVFYVPFVSTKRRFGEI